MTAPQPRLAEVLATLSLATDLGMGQSMEHMLRQSLVALRLAGRLGLGDDERTVVYYGSLLAWERPFRRPLPTGGGLSTPAPPVHSASYRLA